MYRRIVLDGSTIERAQAKGGDTPFAIALSGGGDSTALLHLLVAELGAARLHALIVDHALRDGSTEDARRALGFAQALGVAGDILTLSWPQGPRRAQNATRRARYEALCDAARRLGVCVLMLGHTADDQAETVLMRAASGSGWRGLAGMAPIAPAPVWPQGRGVWLARPLLGVRRETLRRHLRARDANWLDDPANENRDFERVRIRARLAELEAAGFEPTRLTLIAARLRVLADNVDRAAAALIASATRFSGADIALARAAWEGDGEVRRRALAVLIMAAAGTERTPDTSALERLEARFAASDFRGATLGGARFSTTPNEIVIGRDVGALVGRADGAGPAPILALAQGVETIWDGRLAVLTNETGWSIAPDEAGRPRLFHGGIAFSLEDAAGRVGFSWLIEGRVAQWLDAG